jgi:hypothetical protein
MGRGKAEKLNDFIPDTGASGYGDSVGNRGSDPTWNLIRSG